MCPSFMQFRSFTSGFAQREDSIILSHYSKQSPDLVSGIKREGTFFCPSHSLSQSEYNQGQGNEFNLLGICVHASPSCPSLQSWEELALEFCRVEGLFVTEGDQLLVIGSSSLLILCINILRPTGQDSRSGHSGKKPKGYPSWIHIRRN